MDHRIALKPNTSLRLCNNKGEAIQCVVDNEIGRGGSCIVYDAFRETETGDRTFYRVKEFYPYKLNIIRDGENYLVPAYDDKEAFNQQQKQFLVDFSRANQLFYSDSNYALMTNQLDVFEQNGTSYILSAYSSKKTLAVYKPQSLKECVVLVKQVAYVLEKIHKQGYLYLDIKPDNVLVVDGMQKQIQLFDFDSLIPLSDIKRNTGLNYNDLRLSFSKGFAPIELQTSKIRHLGAHTDVFSVGALLFYLIFGITPSAVDCEMDAEYSYSNILYDDQKCDDKLFDALTVFFHNALAVYYADRYQSMNDVYEQLTVIEKYSDVMVPRIFSTPIIRPKYLFGRDHEFEKLDCLLSDSNYNCLFITGMGGIGKSSFIREYLFRNQKKYDIMLYMHLKGSIEKTISDDTNIEINTLKQDEEAKNGERYFDKKINKIRELTRDKATILVIDNFTGNVDEDLYKLLSTGCKIILVTRKNPTYQSCYKMEINAIVDDKALRQIFEANLGRSIAKEEYNSFNEILKRIDRHTLVLELVAKQIANSYMTIASVSALADKHGFLFIAKEKVEYEKDNQSSSDTIGNIIDALFEANALTERKKTIMKVASLLGDDGMDINQFHHILKIECKDDMNELIKDGWMMIANDIITMHRVIQESVRRWEWMPSYMTAAESFLSYFYIEIRLESTKNNYPLKLHNRWLALERSLSLTATKSKFCKEMIYRRKHIMEKQCQKNGIVGKVTWERYVRATDESAADIKRLSLLLMQAEDILNQCECDPVIKSNEAYVNLLYVTLLNMPRYKEEYILEETSEIFLNHTHDFVISGANELLDMSESKNPITILQLYAMVILIHVENGRVDEAEVLCKQAKQLCKTADHHRVYALYYNLLSNYYDILLDGTYDTENPTEELLLDKILQSIEQTLHYSKKAISCDENHLYANNTLAKATILMRSGRGTKKQIDRLLKTAQKIIMENTLPYADVRLHYYLVCGWYFALIHDDVKSTDIFVQKAKSLSAIITPNSLRKIEEILIPCANMLFELNCYEKAIDLLYEGTRLCHDHSNTDSYARIKQKLCDHIWQVGFKANAYDLCNKIMQIIDYENKDIVDPKNRVVISDDIRLIILSHQTA